MKTYIPLNTINSDFDRVTLRERLDDVTEEKKRLQKYNLNLKLEIINLKEKIINIQKSKK
jgi:hypothetical protein|tara:strand:- start:31 stop:210 length:180 start_codon:yes stop_codon:yes gene_type:complete